MVNYLDLKNGSDVRGIAMENEAGMPVTLTEEVVSNIAKAFCVWLISHTGKTTVSVAIGHDSRITSPTLCEAAAEGIVATGHNVVVTDLSTTPSMLMLLNDEEYKAQYPCDGSIMITASHLPAQYNGMKFFFNKGCLRSADVQSILEMADSYRYAEPAQEGARENAPYLDRYAQRLVDFVRNATGEETPLLNKKIIVDAGNGAGGFYADKVLIPLGADTEGSQFLEPNGTFPNHIPNPENKESMASICEAVKANKADLGIIFDTDVDRAGAVTQDGNELNRNRLIALISAILLSEKPGTIVTDSITSDGLTKFIEARGGKHHRFKRGYSNVINEAIRLNQSGEYTPLAIETSGHAALLENDFQDDGAYLITRILITFAQAAKAGKSLEDLIADLEAPKDAMEIRLPIVNTDETQLEFAHIINHYYAYTLNTPYVTPVEECYEGCRANYDEKHGNGWAMLRASLHEPILSVNIESASEHGAIKIAKDLYYFLQKFPTVDVTPLKNAIEEARQRLIAAIRSDFYANNNYLTFIFGEKVIVQEEENVEPVPEMAAVSAEETAPATEITSETEANA